MRLKYFFPYDCDNDIDRTDVIPRIFPKRCFFLLHLACLRLFAFTDVDVVWGEAIFICAFYRIQRSISEKSLILQWNTLSSLFLHFPSKITQNGSNHWWHINIFGEGITIYRVALCYIQAELKNE